MECACDNVLHIDRLYLHIYLRVPMHLRLATDKQLNNHVGTYCQASGDGGHTNDKSQNVDLRTEH